jgi:hypothetical protein
MGIGQGSSRGHDMSKARVRWDRDRKSLCGRFRISDAGIGGMWVLYDRQQRGEGGGPKRYQFRLLADARAYAERLAEEGSWPGG